MSASKMLAQLRSQVGTVEEEPRAPKKPIKIVVTTDSEEEEPEPESVAWEMDSDSEEAPDILDPKFDWRRETRRGRKSRKNYSQFLADRIRENEDELREEREAHAGDGGPDFS
jgi:hypothetical protein